MPATSKKKRPVKKPLAAIPPAVAPFELRKSHIQGRGAFATRPIKKGERFVEYTGERISQKEADKRYDDSRMERHHTFLFSVDARTVIDATHTGNDARFINHSCAGNCEAVIDNRRIFIEALRDIAPGEELAYDYGYERGEPEDDAELEALYPCRCGAPECRGTILAARKEAPAAKTAKAKKAPAKKKSAAKKKRK
ncbi:SET domain-containing protein [Aggregicoccus sp. 17bor-14]|uniref:SET domain-containing protein n=1 Tax=Myxococcaceae TaxID=31 RepID=UPI00129CF034|nr:SET domain-containing protein-lysine N-methyltransferase [Simulacricoccus sp. 17bor-14]MRI87844.1 SET domain-containing protein [Aggregicoccus sp. 17bor-14]